MRLFQLDIEILAIRSHAFQQSGLLCSEWIRDLFVYLHNPDQCDSYLAFDAIDIYILARLKIASKILIYNFHDFSGR